MLDAVEIDGVREALGEGRVGSIVETDRWEDRYANDVICSAPPVPEPEVESVC